MQLDSPKRKTNVTPLHGNSKDVTVIIKLSCKADLKENFSHTAFILPQLVKEDIETRKSSLSCKMRIPLHSV